MTTKLCTIKLLNRSFDIKCPDGEEDTLRLAAAKLNELVLQQKSKHKPLNDFQSLVLAALNISHELINSQKEQEKQQLKVNQFIHSLEDKINKVVEGA